jgi:DNA-binding Lrp family transcriptional regulator
LAGRSELARDDGPQWNPQLVRDLGGDDDAAAWDSGDDGIRLVPQALAQGRTESAAGVRAVGEDGLGHAHYDARVTASKGVRMAITAYVLIQTEVGKAVSVAEEARKISGVMSADDVTGPYDVIVKTEAPSLDDLGKMVVSQIQAVEGITRTFTCPVVNL